jgi:uncharacterized protein (TIGR04255 family)
LYFSLVFKPLANVRLHHVGLLWLRFKAEYSKVEYAPRVGNILPDILGAGRLAVSRTWFVADSDDVLIQFQDDRIIFNWRKRPEVGDYRRYPYVFMGFNDALDTLHNFVEEHDLGAIEPLQCELNYINTIPKGEGWDEEGGIESLFPDVHWREDKGRFLPRPALSMWQAEFPMPKGSGKLIVKL